MTEEAIWDAIQVLESYDIDTTSLCFRHPSSDDAFQIIESCSSLLTTTATLYLQEQQDEQDSLSSPAAETVGYYVFNMLGALASILSVALVAGLFLGLLTLDALDLQIIQRVSIDEQEREYATNLFPIVKDRHRLLVTLLILNALAYEALPIFLDRLVPSWAAIVLSTTLILLFGEIVPSAVFTGPKQLFLGNALVPLTKFFLFVLYPLALPLSLLLDHIVHGSIDKKEHAVDMGYDRAELAALVRIQHEDRIAQRSKRVSVASSYLQDTTRKRTITRKESKAKDQTWGALKREMVERVRLQSNPEDPDTMLKHDDGEFTVTDEDKNEVAVKQLNPELHQTEVDLVEGALRMKTRLVMDVYTPLRQVYAVPSDLILDKERMSQLYSLGWSRIPVYKRNDKDPNDHTAILGYFLTRQLILVDWEDEREVSTLPFHKPLAVSPRMNLVDLLHALQGAKYSIHSIRPSHRGGPLAFVCARPDLANTALESGGVDDDVPIPVHAGFMGIITLEDVMESIIGDRIYDEQDVKHRDRAIATLQRWAVLKLQSFVRKKRRGSLGGSPQRQLSPSATLRPDLPTEATESTPLLPV